MVCGRCFNNRLIYWILHNIMYHKIGLDYKLYPHEYAEKLYFHPIFGQYVLPNQYKKYNVLHLQMHPLVTHFVFA